MFEGVPVFVEVRITNSWAVTHITIALETVCGDPTHRIINADPTILTKRATKI